MSTNTEESLFMPFGNYRYEVGITYIAKVSFLYPKFSILEIRSA